MQEPKLELKKVNNQLSRLELVKRKAKIRTNARIVEMKAKEELKALEQENLAEAVEPPKKGK